MKKLDIDIELLPGSLLMGVLEDAIDRGDPDELKTWLFLLKKMEHNNKKRYSSKFFERIMEMHIKLDHGFNPVVLRLKE